METRFNMTIPDTAPQVSYFPYSEGNVSVGWDSWYTGSGFISSPGEIGNGTSTHITSSIGAEFDISFYGTDIWLFGEAVHTIFNTILDSVEYMGQPQQDGVLAVFKDLEPGWHQISLKVNGTAAASDPILVFEEAIVTVPTGYSGTSVWDVSHDYSDSSFTFAGQWNTGNTTDASGKAVNYQQTSRTGDSAVMTFNGTAIAVSGVRGPNSGHYYVTIKDPYYLNTVILNGQSDWEIPNAMLFQQAGLSDNCSHQIIVTNIDEGHTLAVSSFVNTEVNGGQLIATTSPSHPGSPLPVGTIIAISLAVTAAMVIIFLCLLRRCSCFRRRSTSGPRTLLPFHVNRSRSAPEVVQTYDHSSRVPVSSADIIRIPSPPDEDQQPEDTRPQPSTSRLSLMPRPTQLSPIPERRTPLDDQAAPFSSGTAQQTLQRNTSNRMSALAAVRTSMIARAGSPPGHRRMSSDAFSSSSPRSSLSSGVPIAPSHYFKLSPQMADADEIMPPITPGRRNTGIVDPQQLFMLLGHPEGR